jgi:hypothetical protein
MKAYRDVEVLLNVFITSILDGDDYVTLESQPLSQ